MVIVTQGENKFMKIGDKVKIIISPYTSVKINTITTIENIKLNHFGKNEHLYVLSNLKNKNFRIYEIMLVEN